MSLLKVHPCQAKEKLCVKLGVTGILSCYSIICSHSMNHGLLRWDVNRFPGCEKWQIHLSRCESVVNAKEKKMGTLGGVELALLRIYMNHV